MKIVVSIVLWLWRYGRAVLRLMLCLCYLTVLYGWARLYSLFPKYAQINARIGFARQNFFRTATWLVKARVHLINSSVVDVNQPCMYVCNHISWMDILALYHSLPVAFISKSEIADWPFIGFFAKWAGTIFLRRGYSGRQVIAQTAESLVVRNVALFPEGTSTDGRQVRRFLYPVFRAAIEARVAVVPVSLHYVCHGHDPSGLGISYTGDDTMLANLWRTAQLDSTDVYIKLHPAIPTESCTAVELARLAHSQVTEGLVDLRAEFVGQTQRDGRAGDD